jgi:hypothetical protein
MRLETMRENYEEPCWRHTTEVETWNKSSFLLVWGKMTTSWRKTTAYTHNFPEYAFCVGTGISLRTSVRGSSISSRFSSSFFITPTHLPSSPHTFRFIRCNKLNLSPSRKCIYCPINLWTTPVINIPNHTINTPGITSRHNGDHTVFDVTVVSVLSYCLHSTLQSGRRRWWPGRRWWGPTQS